MNKQPPSSPKPDDSLPHGEEAEKRELKLQHSFNYLSHGKAKSIKKPKEDNEVIISQPGQAREIAKQAEDHRAGGYPQHNSEGDFHLEIAQIEAFNMDYYKDFIDHADLERHGFEERNASFTKKKLGKISKQFAHLSMLALKQMIRLTNKDKRDFKVWLKVVDKCNYQIAIINEKTGFTQFIQTIKKDSNAKVISIKHCMLDNGQVFVVNESMIDGNNSLRQIAHVGTKAAKSKNINAVERFDDGTVAWTITNPLHSGTAALKVNNEIVIVGEFNEAAMLAARNLGAENIDEQGVSAGKFCIEACLPGGNPKVLEYKDGVRKQINHIIDGSSLPGLDPIFDVKLEGAKL